MAEMLLTSSCPPSQGQDFVSLSNEFHKVPVVPFHLETLQIALLHNILGSQVLVLVTDHQQYPISIPLLFTL